MTKPLIIFGTGQQSDIISFYLKKNSRDIFAYCVDEKFYRSSKFNNKRVITTSELIKNYKPKEYKLHIAISYSNLNELRKDKFLFFKKRGYKFETIISDIKYYNSKFSPGENSVILESYVQPDAKIGHNSFIWSGSIIGHHSNIKNHCWVSSGTAIGGNSNIDDLSFFGMNSTVGHFVKIGKSCFIGSGSHITKNVKKNSVVVQPESKILDFEAKKFLQIKNFK